MSEREEHSVEFAQAREQLPSPEPSPEAGFDALEQRVDDAAAVFVTETLETARACEGSASEATRELGEKLAALAAEAERRATETVRLLRELARPPKMSAEEILAMFEAAGAHGRVVDVPNGVEYQKAIVFPRPAGASEPLVRIYRGINHLDRSLLRQVPYALRSRVPNADGRGTSLHILEHARAEALELAEEPTHENLMRYAEAVWPDLSDDEIRRFDADLEGIEDAVLRGISLHLVLAHKTYGFNGSNYADVGIPPYMSAATDPRMAVGYGRAGILVMDIPVSKLSAHHHDLGDEVVVKGEIGPEQIVAIFPSWIRGPSEFEERVHDFQAAMDSVAPAIGHAVVTGEAADGLYREERERARRQDDAHRESNIASVRRRRADVVRRRFGETGVTEADARRLAEEESTDVYTATMRAIYDRLADRFVAADDRHKRSELEMWYVYDRKTDQNTWESADVHYVRAQVTDKMLSALRRLVRRIEERERR